jgi:nucleotide-binding universal stress UspA family protein
VALKDLLVHVDQTEAAFVRLRLAADLAYRHGSRLTALFVKELNVEQIEARSTAELGLVSAAQLCRLDERIDHSIESAAEHLRSVLETLGRERGLETEWRCLGGLASVVVPQHARYAGLCILGQSAPDMASAGYSFSEQLLFVTGRPVLFVPPVGSFETLGRHILVAWNSSRASARAVNDAVPLIERAERTTVLTVNTKKFIEGYGALPPERMVAHLRRHNEAVEGVRIVDVPGGSIAEVLQAEARKVGADLLVAGAFGHPKLWEKMLGGVTHDLLADMTLPTFMSH